MKGKPATIRVVAVLIALFSVPATVAPASAATIVREAEQSMSIVTSGEVNPCNGDTGHFELVGNVRYQITETATMWRVDFHENYRARFVADGDGESADGSIVNHGNDAMRASGGSETFHSTAIFHGDDGSRIRILFARQLTVTPDGDARVDIERLAMECA